MNDEIRAFTEAKVAAESSSHLAQLTIQIDRYEKNVSALDAQLRPVSLGPEDMAEAELATVPYHSDHVLHTEIRRLEDVNQAFERVRDRIRL